jgi:hypothetical protein
VEQKNGAVVRKLVGYERFSGLDATRALAKLYAASRLYINYFQPSFKLKSKTRDGAHVTKKGTPIKSSMGKKRLVLLADC